MGLNPVGLGTVHLARKRLGHQTRDQPIARRLAKHISANGGIGPVAGPFPLFQNPLLESFPPFSQLSPADKDGEDPARLRNAHIATTRSPTPAPTTTQAHGRSFFLNLFM